MGLVKTRLPLTPTTVPTPSGMRERYLAVIAAGRMDSAPSALPRRVTASQRTQTP